MSERLSERVFIRVTPSLKLALQSAAKRLRVTERDIVRWSLSCLLSSDDIASSLLNSIIKQRQKD